MEKISSYCTDVKEKTLAMSGGGTDMIWTREGHLPSPVCSGGLGRQLQEGQRGTWGVDKGRNFHPFPKEL